uniref:non-specific serine/threonine protein kinase n=1 Tax=Sparus aurata TaxID=8175 RepID=A0A671TN95_SPAAU
GTFTACGYFMHLQKTVNDLTYISNWAPRQDFHTTYEQLELLGEGGFGSVFAGIRGEDHFPVAIKRGEQTLPLQVVIMLKMAKGSEGKSAAIAPLDFYDLDRELILVLERPDPCQDLLEYINHISCRKRQVEGSL